ncbi:MAG: type II secretion system protein GspJ [Gammaproteobacteria bacterium]|nr:MAG: type II secretion system protein GspJ [Gammaproteobacteria bacterium]
MRKNNSGFTLLEILIALFIFTMLSLMLTTALHHVITLQAGTERNAERLRQLQMALLIFSRDIEQAVNRPVLNAAGKEERAFLGSSQSLTFTHASLTLQRTTYQWHDPSFSRLTLPVLDQASSSPPHRRDLLDNVSAVRFEYLDQQGHVYSQWPVTGKESTEPLPRAVRIYLTFSSGGQLSQLYVISA